jgi:hypothetical protein
VPLITRIEIHTTESPTQLDFIIIRHIGILELIGGPLGLALFLRYTWHAHPTSFKIAIAVGILSLAGSWLNSRNTRLTVTENELTAHGNLGLNFGKALKISAAQITLLGFDQGGGGHPPGLYARQGNKRSCLIPYLSRKDAAQITSVIQQRFPIYLRNKPESGSIFYGHSSGLITLNLNDKQQTIQAPVPEA